jgi:hypothetical protein
LLLDLAKTLRSDAFAQSARHPDFPRAFTRQRQLPLPALRIPANVTGDFGNVTDLGLGAGLRG